MGVTRIIYAPKERGDNKNQSVTTCREASIRSMSSRGLQFYTFFGISIGIKQRLIDIAKKITFYFLQNVLKCIVFFAFAFKKVAKSAMMTQKLFFLKNINMGIKKTQNFMLISNSLMPAFRNAPNKS